MDLEVIRSAARGDLRNFEINYHKCIRNPPANRWPRINFEQCSIMVASALGHSNIVKRLLHFNVEPNSVKVFWQNSHLYWGKNKLIARILKKIELDMMPFTSGWSPTVSPACLAAYYGHIDVLAVLNDGGADFGYNPFTKIQCNLFQERPFLNTVLCAIYGKHYKLAEMLMDMGVDIPKEADKCVLCNKFKRRRALDMANILLYKTVPMDVFVIITKYV